MNFIKSALGLPWLVCAARLVYMSRLYRKTSAERRSPVQVRLVHHGIIWKRAKEPQLIKYSLSVSSTTGKKASPPQSILGRKLFNGVLFTGFERESLYSCSDKTVLTNQ